MPVGESSAGQGHGHGPSRLATMLSTAASRTDVTLLTPSGPSSTRNRRRSRGRVPSAKKLGSFKRGASYRSSVAPSMKTAVMPEPTPASVQVITATQPPLAAPSEDDPNGSRCSMTSESEVLDANATASVTADRPVPPARLNRRGSRTCWQEIDERNTSTIGPVSADIPATAWDTGATDDESRVSSFS